MRGLLSNFRSSVTLAVIVSTAASLAALFVGLRRRSVGRPWLAPSARILTAGAAVATVVATALPRSARIEVDGDLVWAIGGAGLSTLDEIAADPTSLAAVLFVGNVVLYAAVAFCAVIGWYGSRRWVLPWCLALSVGVEAAQYLVLGRVAATDDVLVNLAGAVLGYVGATFAVRLGLAPAGQISDGV